MELEGTIRENKPVVTVEVASVRIADVTASVVVRIVVLMLLTESPRRSVVNNSAPSCPRLGGTEVIFSYSSASTSIYSEPGAGACVDVLSRG